MNPIVPVLITLLGKLVPAIGANAGLINTIIEALQQIMPFVVQEYNDLLPVVKNVIAALKGTDGITKDQWDQLDQLETIADDEFDQAAKDEGV